MNEITLQKIFEQFLIQNKIEYEREFKTHYYTIDFKIRLGDKTCGVEAKSSKGNIFYMLGQLILAKKTFSHIYLLAPQDMIDKTQSVVESVGVGIIAFKEGKFFFLKEPKPASYYFNQPEKKDSKLDFQKPKRKNIIIADRDYSILTNFENKVFSPLDVTKVMKITRSDAYARIERLLKVGLLEEESSFNPKMYRVKKVVDWGTKIPLP